MNPAGTSVFVSDVSTNSVSVVDTTTGHVTATIPVGPYPIGLSVAPKGDRLYVASYLGDTVSVIDTTTNTVEATIPVGGGPYGVAVSPVPSALLGGPAWELVMDSGLTSGTFSIVVLGKLGGDLYVLGSQVEGAGALAGVFRYRNGALIKIGDVTGQDYNRFLDYGAVEYDGGLIIGDRHGGKLYRMDLADDGSATVRQIALVGGEDVFPGPVLWGKLWLGTFGRLGSSPLNPGVYSYDGTVVSLTHEFRLTGPGGQVLSLIPHAGKLWASTREAAGDEGRVWSSDDGFTWVREYSGIPYLLTEWRNELLGCKAAVRNQAVPPQFAVWRDGWVDVSPPFGLGTSLSGILPVGPDVLAFDYYDGVYAFGGGFVAALPGLGVFAGDGGVTSAQIHDGYLWVTTNQPVRLYRRMLEHRVYVTSFLDGTLSAIDPITNTVNATVPVGAGPLGVAVDPVGTDVWVANFQDGTVSRVDVATATVAATVPVGTNPAAIAAAATRVYVTNYGDGTVSVIDTTSNMVVATVAVGAHPYGVAVSTDAAAVYVANQADDTVSVIDHQSNTVVATVRVGQRPSAFGVFTGGPAPTPCMLPGPDGCDDEDTCTVDSCTVEGGCLHTPIIGCCNGDVDCDDSTVCTGVETCVDHACVADTPLACDDGNQCTDDRCDPVDGCEHLVRGGACDDQDACTTNDTCVAGTCQGTTSICNDDDLCTADGCDPASGCTFTPIPECCHGAGDCDDGDACTIDSCEPGNRCTHVRIPGCCDNDGACDDGDACTIDSCLGSLGCLHRPIDAAGATMCRLDSIALTLSAAPPNSLGGLSPQRRLERLIRAARELLVSRPKGLGARLASLRLADFIRRVQRGTRRGSIDPTVADRLLALARDASAQLAARKTRAR